MPGGILSEEIVCGTWFYYYASTRFCLSWTGDGWLLIDESVAAEPLLKMKKVVTADEAVTKSKNFILENYSV